MGNYVRNNLVPNERIVDETHLHWIIFLKTVLFFIVCLVIGAASYANIETYGAYILLAFIIIGVIALFAKIIKYITTEIAITSTRIMVKRGFIARRASDISLKKVEGVDIKQGIIGRILDYGSMKVRGTGSGDVWYHYIAKPYDFQRSLNSILNQ